MEFNREQTSRAGFIESAAGIFPFFSGGLVITLMEWPRDLLPLGGVRAALTGAMIVIFLSGMFIGFCAGWVRGFPRWSFAYFSFIVLLSVYMMNVATPGLRLFGHTFEHDELWGCRAIIPLAVIFAAAALITRSRHQLRKFAAGVAAEPERLSFAVYGALPLLLPLIYDEVNNSYQMPFMLAHTALMTAGAWLFMRGRTAQLRLAGLLGAAAAFILLHAVFMGVYWHGFTSDWHPEPTNGWNIFFRTMISGTIYLLVMAAPGTAIWLHRGTGPEQKGPPH